MHRIARALPFLAILPACSDPPDDSPLGREMTALLARPEQDVEQVKVQHILVAFVGAKKGSESKRTMDQARELATDVLARARKGEDFTAMMKSYTGDESTGFFTLTPSNRGEYARDFAAVAFRLAPGEFGVTTFSWAGSPFGFHVIKRLE